MIRIGATILFISIAVSGCSSTTPSGTLVHSCGSGTATGTMSANVSGTNFTATCLLTITSTAGLLAVGGTNVSSSHMTDFIDLTFALTSPAVGTFSFNGSTNPPNPNNGALSIGGSKLWEVGSLDTGSSGTVTITTLTATRVAGTFSFNMVAGPGGSGTKTVSNGKFDITF